MFDFIYDELEQKYTFWWECFEFPIGILQEIAPGLWKCCPCWQAQLRFDLQCREIAAVTKEEAVLIWISEVDKNANN